MPESVEAGAGRPEAAAAAASSDTARGLALRGSLFYPNDPRPAFRRQENLRVREGSCRTHGRPPPAGSCSGSPPSFLLPHLNREGLGHSPVASPLSGPGRGGGRRVPPPLSRGSQDRGAA
ncbi:hypothetical protein MC885_000362, partial [Smutsia gigantea]